MKIVVLAVMLNLSLLLPDFGVVRVKYKNLPHKVKAKIEKMCSSELKVRCYEIHEGKQTLYRAEILCDDNISVIVFDKQGKEIRKE